MATRHPINFDLMEPEEIFELMTEGDEVAGMVLAEIITKHKDGRGIILDLDDMNIRGRQITIGFVDVCEGRYKEFAERVFKRDPWLVASINLRYLKHRAVTRGASFVAKRD